MSFSFWLSKINTRRLVVTVISSAGKILDCYQNPILPLLKDLLFIHISTRTPFVHSSFYRVTHNTEDSQASNSDRYSKPSSQRCLSFGVLIKSKSLTGPHPHIHSKTNQSFSILHLSRYNIHSSCHQADHPCRPSPVVSARVLLLRET